MRLVPLGDKVVVKPLEEEEQTEGGIVLPDTVRERPQEGRVLSVGDGCLLPDGRRQELSVREGDRVLFRKYAGHEIDVDGDKLLVMSQDDILAILC